MTSNIQLLIDNNRAWAAQMVQQRPNFFSDLAQQQTPKYLWIGCSDSRVPATQLVALPPGEMFVHRNVANVVVHSDLNFLAVLQYAVEVLHVRHIIVCGHYSCGGVDAALHNRTFGLIDNWLRHIKDVYRWYESEFDDIPADQRLDLLCELNVAEQVSNVCHTTIVQNAWKRGQPLSVHGFIYSVQNGILKDLGVNISSLDELAPIYRMRRQSEFLGR